MIVISDIKWTLIIPFIIVVASACANSTRADDVAPVNEIVVPQPPISAPSSEFALAAAPAEPEPQVITRMITNTVVIRDDQNHSDTDTVTTTLTYQGPILQIKKVVSDSPPVPGGIITYTLTYSNVGDLPATGVVITETVPDNTTFAGPDNDWSCNIGDAAGTICTHPLVIPLNPGERGTLTFKVRINNSRIMRGIAVPSIRDTAGDEVSTSLQKAKDLRYEVVYYFLDWNTSNTGGATVFNVLDDIINQAQAYNLKLILRIYDSANGRFANELPDNNDFAVFMGQLTNHVKNRPNSDVVVGYVIWNEPNLASEWGGKTPNAAEYVALLRAGYEGAKRGDPNATIVSAPLAPTTDISETAVNDLAFLAQMYDNGLIKYVDYVGVNGLGFQFDPDHDTGTAASNFMRLKYLHDVMLQKGDTQHQVWALEVGWLRESNCDLGQFNAYKVSKQQQVEYLTRAFQKAEQEWPWLDAMIIWNLDFYRYYSRTSAFYWYSIDDGLTDCPDTSF